VVAGIFFRKHIIAPYFNPRLRWWETEARYKISLGVELGSGITANIIDISRSGLFISPAIHLQVGSVYEMRIKCMHHSVDLKGKVMRKASPQETHIGYGVMFVKMSDAEKRGIESLIRALEKHRLRNFARDVLTPAADEPSQPERKETAPRFSLKHSLMLNYWNENVYCTIMDISKNGCFMVSDRVIPMQTTHLMTILCMNAEASVQGKITRKTNLGGMFGYGVRFLNVQRPEKKSIKEVLNMLKRIGAEKRINLASPVSEDIIERGLGSTPYGIVLFFKKLLLKDIR
jgi:hypothetical protein